MGSGRVNNGDGGASANCGSTDGNDRDGRVAGNGRIDAQTPPFRHLA